jgi:hypothetical protein
MKTVKSVSDLKKMALRQGATVDFGSQKFNTAGVRAQVVQRETPRAEPPAPTPPPSPTPAAVDMAPVALAQEKIGAMLAHAIASMPRPHAPVREWLFTVERDKDGLLTTIRATAQE